MHSVKKQPRERMNACPPTGLGPANAKTCLTTCKSRKKSENNRMQALRKWMEARKEWGKSIKGDREATARELRATARELRDIADFEQSNGACPHCWA